MRDSFDHYFAGWNLDPDAPAAAQEEFAVLVAAVGAFVSGDTAAAEQWRVFPLDGKKECFFHFTKLAREAGGIPGHLNGLLDALKADYPRSFG